MRMSCNGCRVLRKGCSENCTIRPCLHWINSPDSQAHATVFLAKFYGRAGIINLINAASPRLRPAIFRSLLYEACGRIVNPIYGSVGLLWSDQWHLCQTAVENVLKGTPITSVSVETATKPAPVNGYDIRHVSKGDVDDDHHVKKFSHSDHIRFKVKTNRTRFKRSDSCKAATSSSLLLAVDELTNPAGSSSSIDSTVSHPSDENASVASTEVAEKKQNVCESDHEEIELNLTLGLRFRPLPKTRSGTQHS